MQADQAKPTVIRFKELEPLGKNPPDTVLPRYKRERYSVLGRANERKPGEAGADLDIGINFGYMHCAPGKGNCSHHHPNWEIFIPLSGTWDVVIEGDKLDGASRMTLQAWDIIVIPPNTFHEATNISDEEGWMMSLNPGAKGASYTLHPQVLEELQHQAESIRDAARRGLDVPAVPAAVS